MSILSIVGLQWGDEGKGKIVDFLSQDANMVVRFQGGHNAGHTIVVEDKTYKLNLLPSNILRPNKVSAIGNGVVIDPDHLLTEIAQLKKQGIEVDNKKLLIAENACLILPIHKLLDALAENFRKGKKIGTTKRGIGPAYSDKVARRAIRICDLADEKIIARKMQEIYDFHLPLLQAHKLDTELDLTKDIKNLIEIGKKISSFSKPLWKIINQQAKENKHIMFEGAQGVMLDIDHGTYPYVTSSNTITPQAFAGSGLGVRNIDHNIAVVKAYTTRVGEGPFPTELNDETGRYLQEKGGEFGTVTGRDRRCGWLDLVQLKQMASICGINSIALTKLDVLSNLDKIKVCTKYKIADKEYDYLPAENSLQEKTTPIYQEFPAWKEEIAGIQDFDKLPDNAKNYLKFIEDFLEIKLDIISTSPKREDTIILKNFF
jgi:adenylosuccinate synthase